MNLEAVPVGVGNGGAIYDAIEPGPERISHAHRARLAGGVHRVPGQRRALQFLAGQPNGARLGVGAWIVLAKDCIRCAHQPLTAARVDNQRAEWDWVGRFESACGELENLAHALFVGRHQTCGNFSCGCHAAIYHNVKAHATSHESNFWMELIRRLREKRGVIFCGLDNVADERIGRVNMNKFVVHIWCLLLFASLSALGCRHSSSETGLTKIILQADWYPQPEHGGFYTALVKDYYKNEGLDVSIQPGGPFVSVEKQVSSGAAQFGMGSSDRTLESVADGLPLVAVAATMQRDPQGIMVRKDSAIRTFADINGHTVAIVPGATWFKYIVQRFQLKNVHVIPATMSVSNFVADPQYIQQAFATSEPFFARQAGIETRVLLTSDAGYDPYRVMFTTREMLQQHPDVAGKFVHASLKGWNDYLNDPAAAHAVIAKLNPALDQDRMQFSWQALRDGHFVTGDESGGGPNGRMDPQRWSTMYKQLLDLKVIDKPFDVATAYTLQFVQAK